MGMGGYKGEVYCSVGCGEGFVLQAFGWFGFVVPYAVADLRVDLFSFNVIGADWEIELINVLIGDFPVAESAILDASEFVFGEIA